jgi:hypothetical protein
MASTAQAAPHTNLVNSREIINNAVSPTAYGGVGWSRELIADLIYYSPGRRMQNKQAWISCVT